MNSGNDFFMKMCREAMEDIASGEKGWREAEPNTLLLAAFGMLSNHLASRIVRPLWWVAGCGCAAVIGFLVKLFILVG